MLIGENKVCLFGCPVMTSPGSGIRDMYDTSLLINNTRYKDHVWDQIETTKKKTKKLSTSFFGKSVKNTGLYFDAL